MSFDVGAFRTQFPEFADTAKYPASMITFWANFASTMVNQNVWTTQYTMGVSLYTAHELVLATQNQSAAKVGGTPGQSGGIPSQKTVGSVTVQYDAQTSKEPNAGYWNQTTYGIQFIRLARIFGAGCIQL